MDEDFESEEEFEVVPNEMLAEFVGSFMSVAGSAEMMYRKHYCELIAQKVYNQFGLDGMCELMMAMDKRADWISDIILEAPDLENIAFKKYGVYDPDLSAKARQTKAIAEMNTKLWRLRRKYAKIIVDEIMGEEQK
jgi:hypothetical protein